MQAEPPEKLEVTIGRIYEERVHVPAPRGSGTLNDDDSSASGLVQAVLADSFFGFLPCQTWCDHHFGQVAEKTWGSCTANSGAYAQVTHSASITTSGRYWIRT